MTQLTGRYPLAELSLEERALALEACWLACEDALREHDLWELRIGKWGPADDYWAEGWHTDMDVGHGITTRGPTPAQALLSLAAKLREPA